MKQIKFDYAMQYWDKHKAFHTKLEGRLFTHFLTGEFMCNESQPRPRRRRVYEEYGVALTASIDNNYHFFSPAGLSIKTTWLNNCGAQYYLIDTTSMSAVNLWNTQDIRSARRCSQNLRYSTAYFTAHDAMPVGGMPCQYAYPDTTVATRKWVADFKILANARLVLDNNTYKPYIHPRNVRLITKKMREKEPYHLVDELVATNMLHFWREPRPELISDSCDYFVVKPK